jgi:hypothetical protein
VRAGQSAIQIVWKPALVRVFCALLVMGMIEVWALW